MITIPTITSTFPLLRGFSHSISRSGLLRPLFSTITKSQLTHNSPLTKLIMQILTQSIIVSKSIMCQRHYIHQLLKDNIMGFTRGSLNFLNKFIRCLLMLITMQAGLPQALTIQRVEVTSTSSSSISHLMPGPLSNSHQRHQARMSK
jgi:hypothetical protein